MRIKLIGRTPKDWIISAQVHLLFKRRGLRLADQKEWEILTEAVVELEKCLKLLEKK